MYALPGSSTGELPASASATMAESLSGAVAPGVAAASEAAGGSPAAGVAAASAGFAPAPVAAASPSAPQATDDQTLSSPSTSDEPITLRISVLLQKAGISSPGWVRPCRPCEGGAACHGTC